MISLWLSVGNGPVWTFPTWGTRVLRQDPFHIGLDAAEFAVHVVPSKRKINPFTFPSVSVLVFSSDLFAVVVLFILYFIREKLSSVLCFRQLMFPTHFCGCSSFIFCLVFFC